MNEFKICRRCNRVLSLDNFHKHPRTLNGTNTDCKKCHKSYNASWYSKNRERCRLLQRQYRIKNHEKIREIERKSFQKNKEQRMRHMKTYITRLKENLFNMYGNKCACCGESTKEFLCIDHIHGGGTQERKRLGTRGILILATREGFPKDKYQLLCHNCNMSLGFFGYCPHRPEIRRPYHKKSRKQPTEDITKSSSRSLTP